MQKEKMRKRGPLVDDNHYFHLDINELLNVDSKRLVLMVDEIEEIVNRNLGKERIDAVNEVALRNVQIQLTSVARHLEPGIRGGKIEK